MGIMDTILDKDSYTSNMTDKDIALSALTTSKANISMLSKAIPEAINPQLRQMLTNQLNACINDHFKLSDISVSKGWYNAYSRPEEQLRNDSYEISQFIQ